LISTALGEFYLDGATMKRLAKRTVPAAFLIAILALGQTTYTPKYKGDPAKSNSEAAALGYMRTVFNAQRQYKKKRGKYATSLAALVGHGSFTKRMVSTDRGDYKASFRSDKDGFTLTMTPAQIDAEHRAFFMDEHGTIRGEEHKAATANSPPVKSES
jgi:hypothetical protein